jgi:hypothetical protein
MEIRGMVVLATVGEVEVVKVGVVLRGEVETSMVRLLRV